MPLIGERRWMWMGHPPFSHGTWFASATGLDVEQAEPPLISFDHMLDGPVAALAMGSHLHHDRVHAWFARLGGNRFATCPLTQGTLLRVHMKSHLDRGAAAAWRALGAVSAHPKHEWWDDAVSFLDVPHRHLQGHGQVTDAWLAEMSRRRGGRVATLDAAFALLHDDVATLLPRGDS